ncbi:retrotransposon protein, putative, unclassified [Tanacetum coccineum]
MDEKRLFLNGLTEDRGLCWHTRWVCCSDHPEKVKPPKERPLYGLKHAPRAGYDEHSNFLMTKGFTNGIQIHQSPRGIFINQAKYTLEILKKHGMDKCDSIGTDQVQPEAYSIPD